MVYGLLGASMDPLSATEALMRQPALGLGATRSSGAPKACDRGRPGEEQDLSCTLRLKSPCLIRANETLPIDQPDLVFSV